MSGAGASGGPAAGAAAIPPGDADGRAGEASPVAPSSTGGDPAPRRYFLGLHVSLQTAGALASAAEALARRAREARLDVRWTAPASYHLTLRYLGPLRAELVGAVRDAATEACADAAPCAFRVARFGAFASAERATVIWAGVAEPAPLVALAAAIERAVVELGLPAEPRPLVPHVTLGRLARPAPVGELLAPHAEQMFSETRATSVVLFEVPVTKGNSGYREVARIALGGATRGPERQTRVVPPGPLATPTPQRPDSPAAPERSDSPETDDGWPRGHAP